MKIHDILVEARSLISKPERWTKGSLARNADGEPITMDGEEAVCWCSYGAVCHVMQSGPGYYDFYREGTAIRRLSEALMFNIYRSPTSPSIIAYNDMESTTHEDIMKVFDHAIANTLGDRQ